MENSSVQCCFTGTIRTLLGRWKIVQFSSMLLYVHKDHKDTMRPVEKNSVQFHVALQGPQGHYEAGGKLFSSVPCCFTKTIRTLLGRWKTVQFSSLLLYVHKDHKNTIRPVENFSSVQCCFTRTIRTLLGRWKKIQFSSVLHYDHKDHKDTIMPMENFSSVQCCFTRTLLGRWKTVQFSSRLLYKDHKDTIRPMENCSVQFNVALCPQGL